MALSLQEKIEDTNQGVYLIGTTPPKIGTDKAQLKTIAEKLLGRLHEIEYDGVVIYDIQDESSRTNQARPFPFKQTVDPREYIFVHERPDDCRYTHVQVQYSTMCPSIQD